MSKKFGRVCLVVLDSAGIGEMPDAAAWGDAGSNTLGHILESRKVDIPNLQALGLGNIAPLKGLAAVESPTGAYGKCTLKSDGKDTTTGHWEMAGIILKQGFPKFPEGFPPRIIDEFVAQAKVPGVLGNIPASGTEIIKDLGEEHIRTGKPIVYTSADSVFQIAAHEEVVPIDRLYEMCGIARNILHGDDEVARVIARPFLGETADTFKRTENRHDYAVPPPSGNLLPLLKDSGRDVVCIGKIASIYDNLGVTEDLTAKNNDQIIDVTIQALNDDSHGIIFSNLVDFDMLFGHRRDVEGYAKALEHFDARLPEIIAAMRDDDLLIMTADHGNDPSYPGSDHTREYVPLIACGKYAKQNVGLGTRQSLSDIGQTIAENFDRKIADGISFLGEIS